MSLKLEKLGAQEVVDEPSSVDGSGEVLEAPADGSGEVVEEPLSADGSAGGGLPFDNKCFPCSMHKLQIYCARGLITPNDTRCLYTRTL